MTQIPASQGIEWIRQGFRLFRQQPAELSMLFLLYMLLMFSLSLIPMIGQLLPLLLVPVFSMAFMQACGLDLEKHPELKTTDFYTSHEAPHMIQNMHYDYPGDPALGDAIAAEL